MSASKHGDARSLALHLTRLFRTVGAHGLAILLMASTCGCASVLWMSKLHHKSTFKEDVCVYQANEVRAAYLRDEQDLLICYRGRKAAPHDGAEKEYTITVPVAELLSPDTHDKENDAVEVRFKPRPGQCLGFRLAACTVTPGWPAAFSDTNSLVRVPITVTSAYEKIDDRATAEHGNRVFVYPERMSFVFVWNDNALDRSQSAGFSFAATMQKRHPVRAALYPLTAPVVFVADIVTIPVKAGFIVYFLLTWDYKMF